MGRADHATPSPLPTRRSVLCGFHSADCPLAGPIHQSTNRSFDQPLCSIPCSSTRPSTRSLTESPYSPGQGRTLLAGRTALQTPPPGQSANPLTAFPTGCCTPGRYGLLCSSSCNCNGRATTSMTPVGWLSVGRSATPVARIVDRPAVVGCQPTAQVLRRVSQHSEANPHRQVVSFNGQGRSQCP